MEPVEVTSKKALKVIESNIRVKEQSANIVPSIKRSEAAKQSRKLQLRVIVDSPTDYQSITYPLWGQLARALNSVGANIVEGLGFGASQNTIRFFKMARGSAYEAIFHAECLGWSGVDDIRSLTETVDRELAELIDELNSALTETDEPE